MSCSVVDPLLNPARQLDADAPRPAAAEGQMVRLSALIGALEESDAQRTDQLSYNEESQLVQARLGVASGLYRALQCKHEPTALHCLRVALSCSAWARSAALAEQAVADIELAALLHDIGKLGIPDVILCKPGALDPQESAVIDGHWKLGRAILESCSAPPPVLDIVQHAAAWFDGSRGSASRGTQIPLGARMLAIVDAYDAMTTDRVYRRAWSRERACEELFYYAGSQFDPELVAQYCRMQEHGQPGAQEAVVRGWLGLLAGAAPQPPWQPAAPRGSARSDDPEWIFQHKLLDNMHDAVVFIDSKMRVLRWNRGAERLTGITAESVEQRLWLPDLLGLRDEHGRPILPEECPVAHAIHTGVQWLRRLSIVGRSGRQVAVDAHAVPVASLDGITHGLTLLLHDVSPQISLEQRCQNLYELATKDPLTQVANRAEFDRVHATFVQAHRDKRLPCSLIMVDIDRFKRINDTFGHQAGDEVIQTMARLLKTSCRQGDLVARYGGEEFVVLCADCDNAAAARRAEELRQALRRTPIAALADQPVTASFGVTEIQPGDTPETMLCRADRALYQAKQQGRDRVVQLGTGGQAVHDLTVEPACGTPRGAGLVLEQQLLTVSPLARTLDKLRGFILDHRALVERADQDRLVLRVGCDADGPLARRGGDRSPPLEVELHLKEEVVGLVDDLRFQRKRTQVRVVITAAPTRRRPQADTVDLARQLLRSLRAYLMATELGPARLRLPDCPQRWLGRLLRFVRPARRRD